MVRFQTEYYAWIKVAGVGANDLVASSRDSYVGYLRTVSELIRKDISPEILSSEADVERIASEIAGSRVPKTITNYKSAMKQYVAMVRAKGLTRNG
jgi:hypothetical protein